MKNLAKKGFSVFNGVWRQTIEHSKKFIFFSRYMNDVFFLLFQDLFNNILLVLPIKVILQSKQGV